MLQKPSPKGSTVTSTTMEPTTAKNTGYPFGLESSRQVPPKSTADGFLSRTEQKVSTASTAVQHQTNSNKSEGQGTDTSPGKTRSSLSVSHLSKKIEEDMAAFSTLSRQDPSQVTSE